MTGKRVLIVGCGKLGIACADLLRSAGYKVTGARRNADALPPWIDALAADVLLKDTLVPAFSVNPDLVIYQVAAAAFTEGAYEAAYVTGLRSVAELAADHDVPLLFVSSTSVYHQRDGSWVDEQSLTEPHTFNGQIMLRGERLAASLSRGASVRFSGIYGPDRLRLIKQVQAGKWSRDDATLTNRIHVSDCAGVLAHLAMAYSEQAQQQPGTAETGIAAARLWLASDHQPSSRAEVSSYIASEMNLDNAMTQTGDAASSALVQPRRAGSKRCSNRQLLASGYRFKYPDFRSGYSELIESYLRQGNKLDLT